MSATPSTANFAGLHVAALESRRAEETSRLIARAGGVPHVSPSLREVPLGANSDAVDFAHRIMTGQMDLVLFTTGVGIRHFVEQLARRIDMARFLAALSDVTTIVRGPKPTAALRELKIEPRIRVPEPNTWREILQTLDAQTSLANQVIGVVEYGIPNPSLVAGLEARGAQVISLKVYDWDLPEDTGPLEENVRAIIAGEIDVLLLTSARQVLHLREVAARTGRDAALVDALGRVVVASIGPTTSETLREEGIGVDLESPHGKLGHLVQHAAENAAALVAQKKRVAHALAAQPADVQRREATAPWRDSLFLRACRMEPVERTPIWLMRQAGRYMKEYRKIRDTTSFLELCKNPRLCSQVMVEAVERLGVDAAIVFSDLLPILEPLGMDLRFERGEGPVIDNPVREPHDVDRVLELESVESLDFVMEAVRRTRADLPAELPLIGFAGAPFTLASYAVEGGASRSFLFTKTLMYRDRGAWDALLGRLVRAIGLYLNAQVAAGAQAVQIFDSWVGCLGPDDYRQYVLPHMRDLFASIAPGAPVIHFATGNPQLLPLMREAGGDVIGVDWRIRLDDAWRTIGHDRAVQGNLDPLVLLAPESEIRRRAGEVLDQAGGKPGHIFNLGHGVLQQTPVENVISLVRAVKELSAT
jgi:uroporphyrinogen decarboxylase